MRDLLKSFDRAQRTAVTLNGWRNCYTKHPIWRNIMIKRILATLMLLGMLGTIAGCNTMHGFGQDVERGGEKIQDKATR